MKAFIENATVIEVNQVPNKDNKVFPALIVCEKGKLYPEIKRVKLAPDQVSKVMQLEGKTVDLRVDMETFNGKTGAYNVYSFISAAAPQAAA